MKEKDEEMLPPELLRAAADHFERLAAGKIVTEKAPTTRGKVKFFRSEKGWGAIASPDLAHDVWVPFTTIDVPGVSALKALQAGDEVEFSYEDCWERQDSWHYRTTWVRPIASEGSA